MTRRGLTIMTTMLLHKDILIPDWANKKAMATLKGYKSYRLSNHAIEHASKDADRSHGYTLDGLRDALNNAIGKWFEPFEVELTKVGPSWEVTKVCIRVPYSKGQDACLAIRTSKMDRSQAFVVTAWLNSTKDPHTTLDATKYATKEDVEAISK